MSSVGLSRLHYAAHIGIDGHLEAQLSVEQASLSRRIIGVAHLWFWFLKGGMKEL